MKPEKDCRYWRAKGRHLWVPYRVKATGHTGECCYGCGMERAR